MGAVGIFDALFSLLPPSKIARCGAAARPLGWPDPTAPPPPRGTLWPDIGCLRQIVPPRKSLIWAFYSGGGESRFTQVKLDSDFTFLAMAGVFGGMSSPSDPPPEQGAESNQTGSTSRGGPPLDQLWAEVGALPLPPLTYDILYIFLRVIAHCTPHLLPVWLIGSLVDPSQRLLSSPTNQPMARIPRANDHPKPQALLKGWVVGCLWWLSAVRVHLPVGGWAEKWPRR